MAKKILQVFDFPRGELGEFEDFFECYFEASNDSYQRWYPGSKLPYGPSEEAVKAMDAALTKAGMEVEKHPYFHVLIHFSW